MSIAHRTRSAIVLAAALSVVACGKDQQPRPLLSGRAVVIGDEYGECVGDCTRRFLVTESGVFPRAKGKSIYNFSDFAAHAFSWTPVEDVDPLLVDSLLRMVPEGIDELPAAAFGSPDAGDWGSLPLVIVESEFSYRAYTLDNQTRNMDERLRPYGELMRRAIRAWSE